MPPLTRRGILTGLAAAPGLSAQPRGNFVVGPAKTIRKRAPSTIIPLAPRPQLFIDDYLILRQENLVRTTHSPRRQPGLVVGHELGVWQPFMTVFRDEERGIWRMWYDAYAKRPGLAEGNYIAYLESADGVKWRAPNLNLLGNSNLLLPVLRGYGVTVIDDGPGFRDPARRFKLGWWGRPHSDSDDDTGLHVAFSPDGLRWTPYDGNPALRDYHEENDPRKALGVGDIVDAFHDPLSGHYGLFVKTFAVPTDGWLPGPKAGSNFRRLVSYTTSVDFVNWKTPWRVVVPEDRDEGTLEFYAVGGTIARGGLLIGCPRMLRDDLPADAAGPIEGIGYSTLVTSRDGEYWERHDGVFLNRSLDPNDFDHAFAWVGCQVIVGDEVYLYYGGYKQGHKVNRYTERQIGLAKLRRDGYVSRDAFGPEPGWLMTPLLRCDRNRQLVVNAEAARGEIRVQARDRWRKVIPGFAFEDCAPLRGEGLAQPVAWSGRSELGSLATAPFHLEFRILNASLYGFEQR
jgi:hypothetical protein